MSGIIMATATMAAVSWQSIFQNSPVMVAKMPAQSYRYFTVPSGSISPSVSWSLNLTATNNGDPDIYCGTNSAVTSSGLLFDYRSSSTLTGSDVIVLSPSDPWWITSSYSSAAVYCAVYASSSLDASYTLTLQQQSGGGGGVSAATPSPPTVVNGDIVGSKGCTATVCSLDNGKLRFRGGVNLRTGKGEGTFTDTAVLTQPSYYDPGRKAWFKLTYQDWALESGLGFGSGLSTNMPPNMWTTGVVHQISACNGLTFDYSDFTVLTYNATTSTTTGYGTISASCPVTLWANDISYPMIVRSNITLGFYDQFASVVNSITNTGSRQLDNTYLWFGTRDDYLGTFDTSMKQRGSFSGTNFVPATTVGQAGSSALKLYTPTDAVLLYSDTPGAEAIFGACCQAFSWAYTTDPSTVPPDNGGAYDNSYAMMLKLGNISVGQTASARWYFGAVPNADFSALVSSVVSAATGLPSSSVSSDGSSNATSSTAPGASDTPVCSSGTPTLDAAFSCSNAGEAIIPVPSAAGVVTVDVTGGGGGNGKGGSASYGGGGGKLIGTFVFPPGTAKLKVIVGASGQTYDSSDTAEGGGTGGQASAVAALDSSDNLLATIAIAGGGGGGGCAPESATNPGPTGGYGGNAWAGFNGYSSYPFTINSLPAIGTTTSSTASDITFAKRGYVGIGAFMGTGAVFTSGGWISTMVWFGGLALPPFSNGTGALAAPRGSYLSSNSISPTNYLTDMSVVFLTNGVLGTNYTLGNNGGSVQDLPAGTIPIAAGGAPVMLNGVRASGGGGSGYGGGASGAVVFPQKVDGPRKQGGGGSGGGNFANYTLAASAVTIGYSGSPSTIGRSSALPGNPKRVGQVVLTFAVAPPSPSSSASPSVSPSASASPSPSSSSGFASSNSVSWTSLSTLGMPSTNSWQSQGQFNYFMIPAYTMSPYRSYELSVAMNYGYKPYFYCGTDPTLDYRGRVQSYMVYGSDVPPSFSNSNSWWASSSMGSSAIYCSAENVYSSASYSVSLVEDYGSTGGGSSYNSTGGQTTGPASPGSNAPVWQSVELNVTYSVSLSGANKVAYFSFPAGAFSASRTYIFPMSLLRGTLPTFRCGASQALDGYGRLSMYGLIGSPMFSPNSPWWINSVYGASEVIYCTVDIVGEGFPADAISVLFFSVTEEGALPLWKPVGIELPVFFTDNIPIYSYKHVMIPAGYLNTSQSYSIKATPLSGSTPTLYCGSQRGLESFGRLQYFVVSSISEIKLSDSYPWWKSYGGGSVAIYCSVEATYSNGTFSVSLIEEDGGYQPLVSATTTPIPTVSFSGDFESPYVYSNPMMMGGGFGQTYYGGSWMGSWYVWKGTVDLVPDSYWPAKGGRQSLDLSGYNAGGIQQYARNLIPGNPYMLSFWYSCNGNAPDSRSAVVRVDNAVLSIIYGNGSMPEFAGITERNAIYKKVSFPFTAQSSEALVSFESRDDGTMGIILDEVAVTGMTPPESPTPTPSHSSSFTPLPTFLTVNTQPTGVMEPRCPSNYQKGSDGRCYALGSPADWQSAGRFCKALGENSGFPPKAAFGAFDNANQAAALLFGKCGMTASGQGAFWVGYSDSNQEGRLQYLNSTADVKLALEYFSARSSDQNTDRKDCVAAVPSLIGGMVLAFRDCAEPLPFCCTTEPSCPNGRLFNPASGSCEPFTAVPPSCPTSSNIYSNFGSPTSGYCYAPSGGGNYYTGADDYCKTMAPGARLAIPRDAKQADVIINQGCRGTWGPGASMWIGMDDIGHDGTYTSPSGADTSFAQNLWAPGQPDNSPGYMGQPMYADNCVAANMVARGYLSDEPYNRYLQFCCEAPVTCPSGFSYNGELDACVGPQLPPCQVGYQRNNYTLQCEPLPCDAGFQRNNITDVCEPVNGGCPQGFARNTTSGECKPIFSCLEAEGATLVAEAGAICYYKATGERTMSANDAQGFCGAVVAGATSAVVTNEAQKHVVMDQRCGYSSPSGWIWTDLKRYNGDQWRYSNPDYSSAYATTLWHLGAPNNNGGDEDCVHVWYSNLLNDVACARSDPPAAGYPCCSVKATCGNGLPAEQCHQSLNQSAPIQAVISPSPAPCPDGYERNAATSECQLRPSTVSPSCPQDIQSGDFSFKQVSSRQCYYARNSAQAQFLDADALCGSYTAGGHLASFHNPDQRRLVRELRCGMPGNDMWTGFNDIETEGTFVWTDGSDPSFGRASWEAGEPSNTNGWEHCAEYRYFGNILNDCGCSDTKVFCCSVPVACPSGYRLDNSSGQCVLSVQVTVLPPPACPAGEKLNATTGLCEPGPCGQGYTRNSATGQCDPVFTCPSASGGVALVAEVNGTCYYKQDRPTGMSANYAMAFCGAVVSGATSAVVTTEMQKQLVLDGHCGLGAEARSWLSLTDEGSEGNFYYPTQEDPSYIINFWHPGQPSNHMGDEHCVEATQWGLLNDVNCRRNDLPLYPCCSVKATCGDGLPSERCVSSWPTCSDGFVPGLGANAGKCVPLPSPSAAPSVTPASTPEPTPGTIELACPERTDNGTYFKTATGQCYFNVQRPMSWLDADSACGAIAPGAHLASFTNPDEKSAVFDNSCGMFNNYGPGIFLGLNDQANEGQWVFPDGRDSSFALQYWDFREPNGGTGANCVDIWIATMNDVPCYEQRHACCSVPGSCPPGYVFGTGDLSTKCVLPSTPTASATPSVSPVPGAEPLCPPVNNAGGRFLERANGTCFYQIPSRNVWQSSESICQGLANGAHLATISNPAHKRVVVDGHCGFSDTTWVWTGLNDQYNEGFWTFVSGDDPAYARTLFGAGKPNGGYGENCGSIIGKGYAPESSLEDMSCWNALVGCCSVKASCPQGFHFGTGELADRCLADPTPSGTPPPTASPSPGTTEPRCPSPGRTNGYDGTFVDKADGRCFYQYPLPANAQTAESYCNFIVSGGHLATVTSPAQKAIVLDRRCGFTASQPVWTGLRSSGGYYWDFRSGHDASPGSYATTLWAPGRPNRIAPMAGLCAQVMASPDAPLLADEYCDTTYGYVCCSVEATSCPENFDLRDNRCWPRSSVTPSPTPSMTPIPEAQLVDLTCPDFVQDGATWVSDGPVNGQCYYNIKGRSSPWGDSMCQNAIPGGHLASFTNAEQKKVVVDDYCGMKDLSGPGTGGYSYWFGAINSQTINYYMGWYPYGTSWAFSDGSDASYLRSIMTAPSYYSWPNTLGGIVMGLWMGMGSTSIGELSTSNSFPSCCSVAVRCPPGYSQGTGNYSTKCLPDNYQRPNVTGPAPSCPISQSKNVSYDSLTSGYCYSSPGIALPYNEAEAYCQRDTPGGHLALVRDPQQKDTVLNRGCGGKYTPYTYAWTALNDLQQEGKFVATSGDDVSYANTLWWYGEPNDDKGAEDCALANAFSIGTISDGGCWQSYQVCCEAKLACPAGFEYDAANNQCLPASRPKDVCPIGNTGPKADWFSRKYFQAPNSNNCLRGIDVPLSQMDAEEACESDTRGAHLTSFSSQKEMEAVFSSGCGGSFSGNATQYWLGARYENDRWTFASGADASFINGLISPASMASLQNFTGPLCAISGVSKDNSAFKVRVVSCDAYYPICCQTRSSCPEGTRASNPSDPNSSCVAYSPSPSSTSARTPSKTPTRTRTRSSSPSKYSSHSPSATVSPLLKPDFDGSFEEPGLSWWYSHTGYYSPSSIGRWQVTAGSVDLVRSTWTPKGGSQSLDLAGGSPGTITQTARGLMPGGSYRLSFWYSGNFDSNGAPRGSRSASVLIDGKEVATVVADNNTPDFAGWASWNPMWKQMEVTFVAISTSVEISFRSASGVAENAGSGVALDEVTLDAIYPSATPTPLPTPTHSYGASVTPTAAATLSPIPMVSFDGGFESPWVSYYMNSQHVQWPGNYLGSWFVSRGSVKIVHENWWPSAYGQQSVDLVGYAGYGPGAIQQTAYNLLPGHVYRLTFWYAGNFADAGTHAAIVRVDGRELATVYANQSMPEFEGSTARNPAYQFVQLNFTASGSSALIAFEAVESWQAQGGIILDEVKIEATPPSPSQTPTPSASITASRTPSPSNSGTPSNSPTPSTSRRPGISLMKPWNGQSVVRGAPFHVEWYGLQRCDENTVTIKLLLPTYRKATGMNGTASKVSWNNNAPAEFVLAEALQGCLGAFEVILPDFIAPGDGYTLSIHVDSGYIFGVSTESAKLTITNNAGSLQCQEAQPWRLMASGKAIQKRWSLPGTVLTLPLRIDGLPWSKLLATRSAIVTALQVDVSRILSIVTSSNRRNPADDVPKPLDVDVDWAKSGPATIAASSLSEAVMFPEDMDSGLYSSAPSIVRVPSGNASTLAVVVFFAAADFGGTSGARDTARFAATVMSRYIPGYGEPQGLPPAQPASSALSLKMADVLPWTTEAATRAARLSALENLDESFYGVEITVDKDFAASPGSLDKSCASLADPSGGRV